MFHLRAAQGAGHQEAKEALVRHFTGDFWRQLALAVDAVLSLAFFAQHSGMVRTSFRLRWARIAPAEWHGAVYKDTCGRFYDAKRPQYGPPHASSTGVEQQTRCMHQ